MRRYARLFNQFNMGIIILECNETILCNIKAVNIS